MQEKVVPMPTGKVNLYLPITFWSEILVHIDRKTEMLEKNYGYGKINVCLTVHDGKITDVIFTDEVRIRGLVDKTKHLQK